MQNSQVFSQGVFSSQGISHIFHSIFTGFHPIVERDFILELFKDIKAKIELVNPKNTCSRLWGFKNTEFVWELKWGFVKAVVSKAVHLWECLSHFVRELSSYSRTLIIRTSIIWTCFPGPVIFSWTLIRCDLQKLKRFKVHLSFQTCFNHCFDLFRTRTLETVTYIQTAHKCK